MKIKYGSEVNSEVLIQYLDRLIGKVWKLLPLWEDSRDSFYSNHATLMQELGGSQNLILYCGFYIELLSKLECLVEIEDHKYVKKHIRESIDIIQTLKKKVGEWNIGDISGQ